MAVLSAAVVISGCGSIYTLSDDFEKEMSQEDSCPQDCVVYRVYGGTALDMCLLRTESAGQGGAIAFWDLPFSLALDTVVLPYTVYKQATVGGSVSQPLGPVSACGVAP